jgi:DNA (cytosine-5)-methyltransferase 1
MQADISLQDPMMFRHIDGYLGSPPCQGFSMAGAGKARADSVHVIEALKKVETSADVERVIAELAPTMTHEGSLLALEPLRRVLALRPTWMAWEQVKEVLPLWEACAEVLRRAGYSVATGILNAEQYGVPQTRRRAILVASLEREARLPIPTHSRYCSHTPERLDEGVKPWVSMAEALGWDERRAVVTGQNSRQARGVIRRFSRSADAPAPTLTGQARSWRLRSNYGTGGDPAARGIRTVDQPAPTLTGKAGRNAWLDPDGEDVGRLTIEQASVLQTFPRDYPWRGGRVAVFQQIGNAVPPLLAQAIVVEVAGL